MNIPGQGFRRGSYQCVCDDGYYFPDRGSTVRAFSGFDIEAAYNSNSSTEDANFRCILCAPGCDTCVDDAPCLYSSSMALRLVVLALAIIQLVTVILISMATHLNRTEVVRLRSTLKHIMLLRSSFVLSKLQLIFPCMDPWRSQNWYVESVLYMCRKHKLTNRKHVLGYKRRCEQYWISTLNVICRIDNKIIVLNRNTVFVFWWR